MPSFLAVGSPAAAPAPLFGLPFLFLDLTQPIALPFVPVNSTSFAFVVPTASSLLGLEVAEQRIDLTPVGTLFATNPILSAVRP